MKVFRDLNNLPKFKNAVLTIGTFDGVHKGHQILLKKVIDKAKAIDGESILVTFYPHPRKVIQADPNIKLITLLEEKISLLKNFGLDNLVIVPFSRAFSNQTAESYIKDFLLKNFNPKEIVIGFDHKFGKNRSGDIETLKKYTNTHKFNIEIINKQTIDNIKVSSSKVRKHIKLGEITKANELLGYNYFINGNVIKGDQIGRTLGFPTANISTDINEKLLPKEGIYVCNINIKEENYNGMLYIGTRPVLNTTTLSIEVHIFKFNRQIYGDHLNVELLKFIRSDEKLLDLNELKAKMEADKKFALSFLNDQNINEFGIQKI